LIFARSEDSTQYVQIFMETMYMNEDMQQEPSASENDSRHAVILLVFGGLIVLVLVVVLAITIFAARGHSDQAEATAETAPVASEEVQTTTTEQPSAEAEAPAEEPTQAEPAAEEATVVEAPAAEETTTEEAAPTEEASAKESAPAEEAAPPEASDNVAKAFVKGTCISCHIIPGVSGANGMVGPDLSNVGVEGATYVEGLSAEEYIRQSIEDPEAFITPACPTGPCPSGVMSPAFAQMLSPEELDGIVAYLSTLKTE
jgi:mono/diheme cytochrome c family protein